MTSNPTPSSKVSFHSNVEIPHLDSPSISKKSSPPAKNNFNRKPLFQRSASLKISYSHSSPNGSFLNFVAQQNAICQPFSLDFRICVSVVLNHFHIDGGSNLPYAL